MGQGGLLGKLFRRKGAEAGSSSVPASDADGASSPGRAPKPHAQDAFPKPFVHDAFPKARVQDAVPQPPAIERWEQDDALRRVLGRAADNAMVIQVLDLCDALRGPTPPGPWREEMTALLGDVDNVASIASLRAIAVRETPFDDPAVDHRVPFVRSVVWAISMTDPGNAVPLLVHIAALYGRPGRGREYRSVALTAVEALGSIGGERALPALRQLRAEAKLGDVRRAASRELDQTLGAAHLSRADVPEWQAETFDLNRDGQRVITQDHGYALTIQLETDGNVFMLYAKANGQLQARKPPIVREDRVREAEEIMAEIRTVVYAERFRLKQLMQDRRTLTYEDWMEFYLGNPVTGQLSRALLWEASGDGGEHWQRFLPVWSTRRETWLRRGDDGKARGLSPESRVRIADAKRLSGAEMRAWALQVWKLKLKQPFKQLDLR